ncbi:MULTISPECIES: FadR/GntR family transcriptional regulator [Microbacterium]|uniref:FadR/GntR family transcriptional regulator n=1 Tax=Microbacterium TaxID=33882 RepID=UPI00146E4296|nr:MULTISPECIES: FadR/GntR family transcriptional regulator [Microbacterium]
MTNLLSDPLAAAEPREQSQTDVVVESVKARILSGELRAGSRLPTEKDLAVEFKVSRSSLREGVRALCMMGVLETRQGDGTYVTALEPGLLLAPMSFLVELYTGPATAHLQAVRRTLETDAASRAALAITDVELSHAESILNDCEGLIAANGLDQVERFIRADMAFHHVIARASGNPVLEALIEALSSRTIRDRMRRATVEHGVLATTHAEHQAILHALRARDPEAARFRMGAHLLGVEDFILDHPVA